jgi:hypothetical protein
MSMSDSIPVSLFGIMAVLLVVRYQGKNECVVGGILQQFELILSMSITTLYNLVGFYSGI